MSCDCELMNNLFDVIKVLILSFVDVNIICYINLFVLNRIKGWVGFIDFNY